MRFKVEFVNAKCDYCNKTYKYHTDSLPEEAFEDFLENQQWKKLGKTLMCSSCITIIGRYQFEVFSGHIKEGEIMPALPTEILTKEPTR